ncbi:MAG: ABC transporter permease [Elusimicrobiota bacterium]
MNYIFEGFREASELLFPPKAEILSIIALSFSVSGSAVVIASVLGIPLGYLTAAGNFRGKKFVLGALNTWMALPAVVIGLFVYSFLSRTGPLGVLGLLFTPAAMVIAQALLALPIITALSVAALSPVVKEQVETALSIGAGRLQTFNLIIREARFALIVAIATGFARVIGETGMTLMVGGNIKGFTRVMTTTIALETMKGNFSTGLALGIVLVAVALVINVLLQYKK